MADDNAKNGGLADLQSPAALAVYKRRAWLAVGGLALFVSFYFLLAGWFGFTAYRLLIGAGSGGNAFWGFITGGCAAFLSVFMLKALVFVKHGQQPDDLEITAQQQPRLFEFLRRLADEAGAPRPHRVFLSPRVNAAVFYDLSVLNLIVPSKKNLEIGIGLVNVLTLGELKAVLAHEFGHFAQKTMAVGRWVYIAQQIAGHIVAKRDAFDRFLEWLSRFDLRVAWVGWILSLVVWSIRSVVDTIFGLVVLMQRALSREMEMQADLVAVSLTGSDALIHALHRLPAADDAWDRTLAFVNSELAQGRAVPDLCAVQTRVMMHMALILDDPQYGRVPPLPAAHPESHRLFKAEMAQPPQMWSTHPLNHEREENAKRRYVAAAIDGNSAWSLFDDPVATREQVSAHLQRQAKAAAAAREDAIKRLDRQFVREYHRRTYRGLYLGRSVTRAAAHAAELFGTPASVAGVDLGALYPASISADIERLRNLGRELAQLQALQSGAFGAGGGSIRYRGEELKRQQLPRVVAQVRREISALETKLAAYDLTCRTAHRVAAAKLGNGWDAYLAGLVGILHYADHTEANLRDAHGLLNNTLAVVTATRRVSSRGVERALKAAGGLYEVLAGVFARAAAVVPDAALLERLQAKNWPEALGELKLPAPTKQNLNEWLKVIDGWVGQATGALGALGSNALEQLLLTESRIARWSAESGTDETAPAPAAVPDSYPTLLPGKERERQQRLGWWARFQTADGWVPATARLVTALAILGVMVGFGASVGVASVTVYNGLARPLKVDVGGRIVQVAPFANASIDVEPDRRIHIAARTAQGNTVEEFDTEVRGSFSHFVYNVAGASPLVEWTATYGNAQPQPEQSLGAPRWSTTDVDILFGEPPAQVKTKSGGASRRVLSGGQDHVPPAVLSALRNDADRKGVILAHARWDAPGAQHTLAWLQSARSLPEFPALLTARLAESPNDVMALRFEQDMAADAGNVAVCERHLALAAKEPDDADLQYVAARCRVSESDRDAAYLAGHQRWPDNGWFAMAVGYGLAERGQWEDAAKNLDAARRRVPGLTDMVIVDLARIRRMLGAAGPVLAQLQKESRELSMYAALEAGTATDSALAKAYVELGRGNLDQALRLAAGDPESQSRLLRLAAASDGAQAETVQRALALPPDRGIDNATLWSSIGLTLREKRDPAPLLEVLDQYPQRHVEPMIQFVRAVNQRDIAGAEHQLARMGPALRGQACTLATILLRDRVPAHWREQAKRLLFVSERPYFI